MIGLVGGLASGKSTVAALLAERGAGVVDADRIAHHVLEREAIKEAIREAFGAEVFDADGSVNRGRLAKATFEGRDNVDRLNAIVHPPILAEIRREVAQLKAECRAPLIVLDAALLMETGLDKELCDALVFVAAPEGLRRCRAEARGMGADQFAGRQHAQYPEDAKRNWADHVVDNAGTREDLRRRVAELWPMLRPAGRRSERTESGVRSTSGSIRKQQ